MNHNDKLQMTNATSKMVTKLKDKKQIYKISGMDCDSCAKMIELDLEDAGITAKCSYAKSILEIIDGHDKTKVVEIVKKSGYTIV